MKHETSALQSLFTSASTFRAAIGVFAIQGIMESTTRQHAAVGGVMTS
jgi:hypothetical protein